MSEWGQSKDTLSEVAPDKLFEFIKEKSELSNEEITLMVSIQLRKSRKNRPGLFRKVLEKNNSFDYEFYEKLCEVFCNFLIGKQSKN